MLYLWPPEADHSLLSQALKIAMNYLGLTGNVDSYEDIQRQVAFAILSAWQAGARHPDTVGKLRH